MSKEPAFRSFPRSRLPARSKRDNEINDATRYTLSLSPRDYTRGIVLESSQLFLQVSRARVRKKKKTLGKEYSEKRIYRHSSAIYDRMRVIGPTSVDLFSFSLQVRNPRDLTFAGPRDNATGRNVRDNPENSRIRII